jgi:ribosomal protein S18 acetylase RimI-like enzyme
VPQILSTPQAFELPAALLSQGYTLRPEADADIPFLQQLYASTRAYELSLASGWSEEQKRDFVLGQFAAQRHHYRTHFPHSAYAMIEHHGVRIGRLYLDDRPDSLHVLDIVLAPETRGKGLGTAILEALIDAASARSKTVGIFVEKFNPALRLYQRLGFEPVADSEVYLEMEWRPDQAKVAQ